MVLHQTFVHMSETQVLNSNADMRERERERERESTQLVIITHLHGPEDDVILSTLRNSELLISTYIALHH